MNELIKRLSALISVKSFITAAVMIVFVILSLRGTINAESDMIVITMVVGFYFGTQSMKK